MATVQAAPATTVTVSIDGHDVCVPEGTTIWEAARQAGIEIPALCHSPRIEPVGVCRLCVVDVGERVLAPACTRVCSDGMTVDASSGKVEKHRAMLTRLLLSGHPVPCEREKTTGDCELEELGRRYGIVQETGVRIQDSGDGSQDTPRSHALRGNANLGRSASTGDAERHGSAFRRRASERDEPIDHSSPVIAVDHRACILCDRCIRACDDLQCNDVIGRTGKGYSSRIAFDLNVPMGESSCVSCGECVSVCPTGALTNKQITLPVVAKSELNATDSVCPYCGVGCTVTFYETENKVVYAEGRESPVNHGRLCVKGRYGWDYASHPHRLTKPLIRRDSAYPKGPLSGEVRDSVRADGRKPGGIVDYDEVLPAFREATWDEALDLVGKRLREIRDTHGASAMAGFGSAKCSNEEAYLFQKVIRAGFGTNNVDHCTRLCHASSVAALLETIGSGAVTNIFADVANSDVALITGTHTTANHPVAATFMKEAARKGTKLILVDVRRHEIADFAAHFAQIRPGTDVAFYNGIMHVLIAEDLIDRTFIEQRTEGFGQLRELLLNDYSPQRASDICGIPADEITAVARTIGNAESMLIFWGMGIAQHTTGTDNARCLISLCLMTGNMGRPGTGLHPLRGQNNVQGASDAGLIPIVYPDYQPVTDPAVREKFSQAWNAELDPNTGLTVVEIMKGAIGKTIRGMYIMGENPFISDPNSNKVRQALCSFDFLVVQDIFLTETAEFADVILPSSSYFEKTGTFTNTDRRVQLGRKVLDPPGEAREDWEITCEIGRRVGLEMNYGSIEDVFDEYASLTENYRTLSHANLGPYGKLWPCPDPSGGDGTQILFGDSFPTASGKGKFVPCPYQPADELPDDDYPLVLNTGRILEHWHTGGMTRRSFALNAIEPAAFALMNPHELESQGLASGDAAQVSSRRGSIRLEIRGDDSIETGSIFIPFHFREAAANVLTTDALDPFGKIPEYKFCAVRVERVAAET